MKARHGHTLIESMVVITMFAVIMTTVALALHATRQANRHVREEAESELEWTRFAAQLRSDAHPAGGAKLENPKDAGSAPRVLSLALGDDQTVDYSLQAECIERVLRRGQAILHRETYRLPASVTANWRLRTGARSPMVSLVLEPVAGRSGRDSAAIPHRVDAAVDLLGSESRKQKL